eukprot:Anaeramoba_flamelloidesa819274_7.p1 GENE.a819274_7~~a819274_7.p1  ORF type:complete len:114 (-),score=30.90 a819274_7:17-358(-)
MGKELGHGVFARETIEAGEIIGIYGGELSLKNNNVTNENKKKKSDAHYEYTQELNLSKIINNDNQSMNFFSFFNQMNEDSNLDFYLNEKNIWKHFKIFPTLAIKHRARNYRFC